MFDRIKKVLDVKVHSRREQADTYKLADKPFTRALLLRASHYQDEAERDLKKMVERTKPIAQDKTFNEFAASCAVTIAYHITTEAMKNTGHDAAFLPSTPVPKYAPMVVAYSLFLLTGIQGQLQAEGVELNFREMAADTANLFFMTHPDEEGAKNAMEGIKAFQIVARGNGNNVKDWHDNLMQLIPMYVLQWTTENQELKKHDFVPLFGSLLSSLLKAVE
jgi:hypothetical protein